MLKLSVHRVSSVSHTRYYEVECWEIRISENFAQTSNEGQIWSSVHEGQCQVLIQWNSVAGETASIQFSEKQLSGILNFGNIEIVRYLFPKNLSTISILLCHSITKYLWSTYSNYKYLSLWLFRCNVDHGIIIIYYYLSIL